MAGLVPEWLSEVLSPKSFQGKSRQSRFVKAIVVTHFFLLAFWGYELYRTSQADTTYYRSFFQSLRGISFGVRDYENALFQSEVTDSSQMSFLDIKEQLEKSMQELEYSLSYKTIKDPHFLEAYPDVVSHLKKRLELAEDLETGRNTLQSLMKTLEESGDSLIQNFSNGKIISIDPSLQHELGLEISNVMLLLRRHHLIDQIQDRSLVFEKITYLRGKIDQFPQDLQGRLYLFSEKAKATAQHLRTMDLLKNDLLTDNLKEKTDLLSQMLSSEQSAHMYSIKTNFDFLLLLGMLLVVSEAIIGLWLLSRLQRVHGLEKQIQVETAKNKQVFEKARQYNQEAHRTQFNLISGFCRDLQHMLYLVVSLSQKIHGQLRGSATQHMGNELMEVNLALQNWVNNYINIHHSEETWPAVNAETVCDIQTLIEKIFLSVRYYGPEVGHKSALTIEETVPKIAKLDSFYAHTLLQNLLLIVLKWVGSSEGLRVDVKQNDVLHTPETSSPSEPSDTTLQAPKILASIEVSFIDSAGSIPFTQRQTYFQAIGSTASWDGMDKFILIALDMCQKMIERIGGSLTLTKDQQNASQLTVTLPYTTLQEMVTPDQKDEEISFDTHDAPLLGKRILVISPYDPIRYGLCEQLKAFECLPEAIADRFAAIGQILDRAEDAPYDGIMIDHCPKQIDSIDVLHKIRSVTTHKPLALIVMVAEEHYEAVKRDASGLAHGLLLKPTVPSKLYSHLTDIFSQDMTLLNATDLENVHEMIIEETGSPSTSILIYEPDDLQEILIKTSLIERGFTVTCFQDENEAISSALSNAYGQIFFSDKLKYHTLAQFGEKLHSAQGQCQTSALILLATKEYTLEECDQNGLDLVLSSPVYQRTLVQVADEWREPTLRRLSNHNPLFYVSAA